MEKQKSLRDVSNALAAATAALEKIERRALYENPQTLDFEQKIIAAVRGLENGEPLKDHVTAAEIEQAIKTLADVYTVTGVKMPADWY